MNGSWERERSLFGKPLQVAIGCPSRDNAHDEEERSLRGERDSVCVRECVREMERGENETERERKRVGE